MIPNDVAPESLLAALQAVEQWARQDADSEVLKDAPHSSTPLEGFAEAQQQALSLIQDKANIATFHGLSVRS